MNDTQTTVLRFMTEYQQVFKRPPTMDEIRSVTAPLTWRSSVRHVLESLLKQGYLEIAAPPRCGRRYRVTQ